MDTFFWSLLLAAISALTYLAYKHPFAFRANIAYPLIALVSLGLIATLAVFLGGVGVLIENLSEEISKLPEEELYMIRFGVSMLKDDYEGVMLWLKFGAAALAYIVLLVNLPKILMFEVDEEKK